MIRQTVLNPSLAFLVLLSADWICSSKERQSELPGLPRLIT